jgi:succinate dehydrogenase / fumarate reductase flavoprotein subunit
MIINAEAILKGALARNESRGAHYKPEFPERNDKEFLKTTIATWNASDGRVDIGFTPVDTSLIQPRPRTYGKGAKAENKPSPTEIAPQPALV